MHTHVKRALKLAAFLFILGPTMLGADVKLRIYLKDGSLQAGNLVKEDTEQFVLLTKEGRIEIPKTNIMFVNGKTLAQWNARPDKNYSTEILPSELPDRGFINEKAELPPPVLLPPIAKPMVPAVVEKPVEEPKAQPVVETPDVTPAQAGVQSVNNTLKKVEDLDSGVRRNDVPVTKPPRRKRPRPVPIAAASIPVEKPAPPEKEFAPAPIVRTGKFDREGYAVNHYNLAMEYMAQGQRGRAAQELHVSHTLNKWDEKTAFALGEFYKEEGIFPRARKYLDLPALRKKDAVKALLTEMDQYDAQRQRQPFINAGLIAAALILPFSGVFLYRRFMRKAATPPPLIVTSENIDEIAKEIEEKESLPTIAPAAESVPPHILPVSKADVPIEKPLPAFETKPLPQPPAIVPMRPPEPVKPPEPMRPPEPIRLEPVLPNEPAKAPEPVRLEPPINPAQPEPIPFQPALQPTAGAPYKIEFTRPYERLMETERVVADALQKGNHFAVEGNIELARREYRTAAALNTASVDAQLGLAYLCFVQEQWELSMQHYLNALQINERSGDAHYGLARVLIEMGRVREAIPEVRRALELDPTLFDAQETLTSLGQLA